LYLLLTGRPPHPEVTCCSRDELAAALRRPVTSPRALWSGVPAALEAICLKALTVEPAGRYGSVAALREDVQHWLADEPVSAYRERLPERLARWSRRHKRAATGAAAVLITAVVALAIGLLAVNRERQETERQRQAVEAALALERDSFRQALKAGDDYFTAVSDSPLLKAPGQQPLRRELLQRGLAYYQDFLARRGDERALRAEVAAAWFRVGQTQAEIGTLAEAVAAFERAITLGEGLLAAEPENVDLRAQVVRSYISSAWSLRQAGRYADALGRLDRADALAGGLPAGYTSYRYPSPTAGALSARSAILADLSDQAGACRAAEQAEGWYARSEQDPRTRIARGGNLTFLGYALRDLKRPAEAADAFHRARSVFEALLDQPGWSLTARWHIGNCENALGLTAFDLGDAAGAMAYFEAAHAARRQLVEQNPTVHSYRAELATTCLNLALEHRNHGDPRRAAELSLEACTQAEELIGRVPAHFNFRSLAVRAQRLAAGDAEAGGDLVAAARLRARSGELLAGFGAPADRAAWQGLARDAIKDGLRQLRWGHWRAAAESFRQAWVCQGRANRVD
jgi:tetratricopeptide (TPR) repeat protein